MEQKSYQDPVAPQTRMRILRAAGEVFAESGFKWATVREICRRAGTNVASINYHFGDKENLYLATLRYWRGLAFQKYPAHSSRDVGRSPEDALGVFIKSFLFRILEEGEISWFGKLVAREYTEPTRALDTLVEETIRPMYEYLASIVRQLLADGVAEETVRFCCASVISQCLYFLYARPIIERLFQPHTLPPEKIAEIAAHVTDFSLAGIKRVGRSDKEVRL
jgi:AcrR family transcriptional regulator